MKVRSINKIMQDEAIELIKATLQSAVNHPAFMGFPEEGITVKTVEREGGDAAFVTADIAWRLREALVILEELDAKGGDAK